MEYNKEEAYRARDVAECKMRCRDFFSARAVALKAQIMFPELENIQKMLSVCNIHCAAETKVGDEMDWYGILQVAINADDAAIKKQYRKLALSLQPHENKSSGAEEAFKLVEEAQRVLLDSKLRWEHNAKRNSVSKQSSGRPHQAPPRNNIRRESSSRSSAFHTLQPQVADTFWTKCSFCRTMFQYHRNVMNKCLRCQHCLKAFTATELSTAKANVSATNNSPFSTTKPATEHASRAGMRAATGTEKDGGTENGQPIAKASKAGNRKGERKAWSESCQSDDGSRSSSDEDDSDDDNFQSDKQSELDGHADETAVNGIKEDSLDAESEFYDFDRDRIESAVKDNQVWALYDERDGLPRFYFHIKKVFESPFKVEFQWLEHYPVCKDEDNWDNSELPVACGYFKHGGVGSCDTVTMLSYPVFTDKRTRIFIIRPMKGEIWGLFSNWNRDWSSNPEKAKTAELEIVEVLSDFEDTCGARVAYMSKVKGFVCLFRRCSPSSFEIPSNELLRFSHRIPAYRLTGVESKFCPEGCVELDPAACPLSYLK